MDQGITDKDLRQRLEACGFDPGPLTEFSRPHWIRKLTEAEKGQQSTSPRSQPSSSRRRHPVRVGLRFPEEEDEISNGVGNAPVPSDGSEDSSDDDSAAAAAKRRAEEELQRKQAVSKVQMAGARVLDDVNKAHLKGRRSSFVLQYSHHLLIGMLLAVACVLLLNAVSYRIVRRSVDARDNFIWCTPGQFCRSKTVERIGSALKLAYQIASVADTVAGGVECGTSEVDSVSSGTLKEIATSIWGQGAEARLILNDALQLMAYNPHWKISVLSSNFIKLEPSDNMAIEELNKAHVVSTNPMKPLMCRLRKAAHSAATQALLLAFLSFVVVLVFVAIRLFVQQKEESRQQVFKMVDRILTHVRDVYKQSEAGIVDSPAVPISHVRDALLPPAQRQTLGHVWQQAVEWINKRESRIRMETRRIAGEDFVVWRWIPITSYAKTTAKGTDETDSGVAAATSPGSTSAEEKLIEREKQWGGHVLEHYSGESFRQQVLPLADKPSCCIKLRNLYSVQPRPADSELRELEAAVLHKLTQYGGVLHCFLDRWTDEGALYAKLNSAEAATSVIAALHGTWYKNRLVKAEYVSLAEYHRLFPSSKNASKLLFPP